MIAHRNRREEKVSNSCCMPSSWSFPYHRDIAMLMADVFASNVVISLMLCEDFPYLVALDVTRYKCANVSFRKK
jgi:hypothetical protein